MDSKYYELTPDDSEWVKAAKIKYDEVCVKYRDAMLDHANEDIILPMVKYLDALEFILQAEIK